MSDASVPKRELPERPSLENLKKQARALLKAARAGSLEARARVLLCYPGLAKGEVFDGARFNLSGAQFVLAREYGFASWAKLKAQLAALADRSPRAEKVLSVAEREAGVRRLYPLIEAVARRVDWLPRGDLARFKSTLDLPRLIAVAATQCSPEQREALSAARDLLSAVEALCGFLERLGAGPAVPLAVPEECAAAPARLVVLAAHSHPHLMGRRFTLSSPSTTLGRAEGNAVQLHGDGVSRVHASIEREGSDFVLVDRGSTNGTCIDPGRKLPARYVLRDGDRLIIGDAILLFSLAPDLDQKCQDALAYCAEFDALTGSRNQVAWLARMEGCVLRARGSGAALSVLLLEVDSLAEVSWSNGALAGQALLAQVAGLVAHALPEQAVLGRCQGDRLAIALPAHDAEQASRLASELRTLIATQTLSAFGAVMPATISVGVSTLYGTTGGEELLADALGALDRARSSGGDRVVGPRAAAA